MRLFLALNLPANVRRHCFEATGPLRQARPDARWVPEGHLHLTLKFLGEQPEGLVPSLTSAIDAIATATRPLDLALGQVGAFPTPKRPRVVYLTVAPDPKLELLHHDVEVACAALALPIEGKPFRPHVTLGRERDGAGQEERRALREAARQVRLKTLAPVASIDLMASERGPEGSRHRLVHAAPFRDR
ncbi:MAG TPA: RNA 2',3'-cyclic phosphodiesterase [Gemmatimonadaceae bacterium]|nr:RNA 2',3'-cyclic phosphodiesterase [Gemmatimonadaceae bacterium]